MTSHLMLPHFKHCMYMYVFHRYMGASYGNGTISKDSVFWNWDMICSNYPTTLRKPGKICDSDIKTGKLVWVLTINLNNKKMNTLGKWQNSSSAFYASHWNNRTCRTVFAVSQIRTVCLLGNWLSWIAFKVSSACEKGYTLNGYTFIIWFRAVH